MKLLTLPKAPPLASHPLLRQLYVTCPSCCDRILPASMRAHALQCIQDRGTLIECPYCQQATP